MLDTIISPNNHAYQFRVDVLPDPEISEDVNILKQHTCIQLCKMLTQEEFADWLCCFEISEAGKHHYQCIIWHKKLLSQKDRNKLKAKYFRKNRDTNNSISFTDAKKITNLSSYVLKDQDDYPGNNIISTLTIEKVKEIPSWLTKNALKSKWKKELEDEILIIISEDVYGHRPSKFSFAQQVIEFHIKNDHPPPSKMMLYKLLLKYHPSYTVPEYMADIGFMSSFSAHDALTWEDNI